MPFPQKNFLRILILISTGFLVLCCLSLFIIPSVQNMVFKQCIKSYGKKLGVQASTVEITKKLFEMINPQLKTDMTVEEVHNAFNKVVPTEFFRQGPTLDGGFQEIATLQICPLVSLRTILVDFSKEGFFVIARLYFGD